MSVPQTSMSSAPAVGLPGQLCCPADPNVIVSYRASEAIPFGSVVELASGAIRRPQTASAIGKIVGVALFGANREPGGWLSGDVVPVLRRGRAFALWNGTTQTAYAVPNVNSSSSTDATTSAVRGYLTDATATTGTAVEIYAMPSGSQLFAATGASGFCQVELNLP